MPQGKNAIFGRNIIQFYYNSPIYAALAGRTGREDAAAGIFGLNIEMLLRFVMRRFSCAGGAVWVTCGGGADGAG